MSEINLTLSLRRPHAEVFSCDKRFIVLVAGRRWGKTMLALWWLVAHAFSNPGRICYYVAPTYSQAKITMTKKVSSATTVGSSRSSWTYLVPEVKGRSS